MNKKKQRLLKRLGIVAGVVVLIVIAVLYQINQSQTRYIQSLETITIERGDITLVALATGKVTSSLSETIKVNGTLTDVLVNVGDVVSEDDKIAEYRNTMGQIVSLFAPMDGIVSQLPSNVANEFVISDPDQLQLVINISESDIYKIELNQEASVYIEAINQTFIGEVVAINPIGNTSLDYTTYPVTVSFDPADEPVLLGMSGSASIDIESRNNILIVPFEAIITEGTQRFVLDAAWRNNPSDSQKDYYIPVTTGFADVFNVEVTGDNLDGLEIIILPKTTQSFLFMRPQ
jgi:multidrug efflux pump subunit AcrA (membrane-fusion protein)